MCNKALAAALILGLNGAVARAEDHVGPDPLAQRCNDLHRQARTVLQATAIGAVHRVGQR